MQIFSVIIDALIQRASEVRNQFGEDIELIFGDGNAINLGSVVRIIKNALKE